ncbi:GerAB/ArcD/ProY family transporter [Brevibacillus borstelensis]|jgi:spore germination protein KB|uniref:GerAB/ArcD/ProY family transporter n=1 Tax=Brevibacillus borstelensis TaxID=45462 RepID=UPI001FAB14E5|nr:endospore germination permease [Brevibacillus borstelensis]
MLEQGKINIRQLTVLVIAFTMGTSFLLGPSPLALEAKQNAWIAAIIGIVIDLVLIVMYVALGNLFPGMTLAQYSEKILGKWPGKLISLLFFSFFIFLSALMVRDLGNFIVSNVMPETPVEVILISFSMVVVIATRYGLEVIARTTEIFFPWIFVSLLFLTFTLLPEIAINQLEPVTEGGIKPLLGAGIQFSSLQEFVCFLMLLPFVNRPKKVLHSLLLGAAAGGVILIIITALCILVLGSDFTARNIYPSFVLAKKISIGNFLERVEVLLAGVWFLSIFIKTTITFYVSALGLAQSLELRTYKPLTVPLGVLMVALSVLAYPNITKLLEFVPKIWFSYAYTFLLLLPLLLLLVALIRGKSEAPLSMEQKD